MLPEVRGGNSVSVRILVGDVRETLATLQDQHFHCCVTSPPYFGLRSYMPDAVRLRDDLSQEERAFVDSELNRLGILHTS